MVLVVLPIRQNSNQTFDCTLSVNRGSKRFRFIFSWNPIGDYWQLTLKDLDTQKEVLNNKPIYSIDFPYNNIISNLNYKGIGNLYLINPTFTTDDRPNYTNLTDFSLIWGDNDEAVS